MRYRTKGRHFRVFLNNFVEVRVSRRIEILLKYCGSYQKRRNTRREGFAMPARIAIVLNEPEVAEEAASALRAQGQDALALVDPMTALEALEGAERIEVLVTCLDFAPGKPTPNAPCSACPLPSRTSSPSKANRSIAPLKFSANLSPLTMRR